ncbi:MAG: GatB/YqeY domain-containing protein [Chloroflexota bacterium]
MDTKAKLEQALKDAMRAGDDVTKRTVRMALAAIRQTEKDKQLSLEENAVLGILQKEIKTRRESVEEASRANRPDIVADTQAEIKVLEAYLPSALNVDEFNALAAAAIAEVGAASPADLGKVMKVLMPRIAGRATGDQASAAVRSLLQK